MAKKKRNKEKTYVCVVCNKTTKAAKGTRCCSKDMTAKEGGTWAA